VVVIEYHLLLLLLDTLYFYLSFCRLHGWWVTLGCWLAHGRGRLVGHLWPVHCVVCSGVGLVTMSIAFRGRMMKQAVYLHRSPSSNYCVVEPNIGM
jgi:hypothetical protein